MLILQLAYLLFMPALAFWLARHSPLAKRLGPVVFAYLFGLLLAQLPINDTAISANIRDLSIPLAIPLLLFGLDVRGWLKGAKATVISFGLCLLALLLVSITAHLIFSSRLEHSADIAGMLTGLYSGGSPNMAVVHGAIDASPELYAQINAVDFASGAAYFLFLITLAGPVYGLFLKPSRPLHSDQPPTERATLTIDWTGAALALGISALIVGVTVAVVLLISSTMAVAPIMLGITSLSIIASFWPRLRKIETGYSMGYYLVTVFCCALGSRLQIDQFGEGLAQIAAMHLSILIGTIVLHLLFVRLAGIDRDTAIITQTAALYGPPFVPPVASALKNPAILLSGLTTGLVGYAVGNYLGIGIALLLR
ncbi:MAG: DUF819 family protein [Oceanococcus sp.]